MSTAQDGGEMEFDALVIGAGFSGLQGLKKLKDLGLSVVAIETAEDVGGVWWWNRFPGARTDSQSWVYCFDDDRLKKSWRWTEKYSPQAEVQAYLAEFARIHNLYPHIRFGTSVTAAHYDEDAQRWSVRTDDGTTYSVRYFVTGTGVTATPYVPDFPGLQDFEGEVLMTRAWPEDGADFSGKRVGVIGTGSTGVSVIPLIAEQAERLTVFQRTPNYVFPARNNKLNDYEWASIARRYDDIMKGVREHPFAFDIPVSATLPDEVSPEEQQRILERAWEKGNHWMLFAAFADVFTSERTNKLAADYIRERIRAIVEDPAVAEKLCPKDHTLGHKRPPVGHDYYETYNRPNVELIDIKDTPIERFEARGLVVDGRLHEVDAVVLATGFDVLTGTLNRIDIRGRGGQRLVDKWAGGPRTYLGVMVDGFPNLFMITGPQAPFANIPTVAEVTADIVTEIVAHARHRASPEVEVSEDAVDGYSDLLSSIFDMTVLGRGESRSWLQGTNVPGKSESPLLWVGGLPGYRAIWADESAKEYPSLQFT